MLTCEFHQDTLDMIKADEFHQLDTRFFRRKLKEGGIKLWNERDGEITVTATGMTSQDNILHVPILGKLGYTFRRIKVNGITSVVVC